MRRHDEATFQIAAVVPKERSALFEKSSGCDHLECIVRSDCRASFGTTIKGKVNARVEGQMQGKRQAGVADAEGNGPRCRMLLVAAQNAVLDVVEGERVAADDVTAQHVTKIGRVSVFTHAMLSKKPPDTEMLERNSFAWITRQLYLMPQCHDKL